MGIFTDGSNRQRIYDLLSDKPITAADLYHATGIDESAILSVLQQICALGYSKKKATPEGSKGWIVGNGKPKSDSKKSISTGKKGPTAKINEYLVKNIGNEVSIPGMKGALKIDVHAAAYKIFSDHEETGHLTKVKTERPYSWRVNPSISEPKQAALLPQSPPAHQPVPVLMPGTAPMDASDAIAALMQVEHKNMINQQGLTQILALYNQLGNVLEMMGLLEE